MPGNRVVHIRGNRLVHFQGNCVVHVGGNPTMLEKIRDHLSLLRATQVLMAEPYLSR